jgi:hypothetical protein
MQVGVSQIGVAEIDSETCHSIRLIASHDKKQAQARCLDRDSRFFGPAPAARAAPHEQKWNTTVDAVAQLADIPGGAIQG